MLGMVGQAESANCILETAPNPPKKAVQNIWQEANEPQQRVEESTYTMSEQGNEHGGNNGIGNEGLVVLKICQGRGSPSVRQQTQHVIACRA